MSDIFLRALHRGSRQPLKQRFCFIATASLLMSSVLPAQTSRAGAPTGAAVQSFQQGIDALRSNRPAEAVTNFEEVTRESPHFAEAYLNLGLSLSQLSRNDEAVRALEKGISIKPSMHGAHLFLAISLYKLGRNEPAASAAQEETKLFPADAQAWMWRGIIELALGRLKLAVENLDHASSLAPTNVDILYHQGRAALALSRQSYEEMFRLDPASWHVHQVLAEADVESGNDLDAIEQFKQAIAAAPPQGGLYEALGSSFWRAGKYDDAQQAYEKALKLDPNDTLTMYKLGCLRIDRSDAAGGKALLEHVLVADPSFAMTTYYLGRAETQLGQDDAAISHFQKTIHDHIDDETTKQAYFQLSRTYRRLHNLQASNEAQAQYRLLDQKSKEAIQEKLNRHRLRAGRDTSIPAPAPDASAAQPDANQ